MVTKGLTAKQEGVLNELPATRDEISNELGISRRAVRYRMNSIEEDFDYEFYMDSDDVWHEGSVDGEDGASLEEEVVDELSAVEQAEEPDMSDLTVREEYILGELETGATVDELASDLGIRTSVVTANLKGITESGWDIYFDETSERIAIESDHPIRSSEHKGTRTRKANQWWELNHNNLVREYRGLDPVDTQLGHTTDAEDWVTHMTDLHAGDVVRSDDGSVTYETDMVPEVVDYVTSQSIHLAQKHNSEYDTAHLLWGGDFVTNENIYEGQFEDIDAWLDEQHDVLIDPLIRQIKTFAEEFDAVQIVCQVGNHGRDRASGSSRQANADLILYKTVRNTLSQIRKHSEDTVLDNVDMKIGQAANYRNFPMRGGELKGHLRHGQHRKPQAETSARKNQWRGTLIDHNFDVALMGHYHISGRIPWDGPPVVVSPSPKPSGEFVEKISGRVKSRYQGVATSFGVSDEGLTAVFPIDMRNY